MADYEFLPNGSVTAGRHGQEIAFFSPDGTIKASRHGKNLGFVEPNGTVRRDSKYGQILGTVESDGTVKQRGQRLGQVDPPVHKAGALLLLLG